MKSFILSLAFFCILSVHTSNSLPLFGSGYYEYRNYGETYGSEYVILSNNERLYIPGNLTTIRDIIEEGSGGSGDHLSENVISGLSPEGSTSDVETHMREMKMTSMVGDDEDLSEESASGDNLLLEFIGDVTDDEASGDNMEDNYEKTSAPADDEESSINETEYSENSAEFSGDEEKQTYDTAEEDSDKASEISQETTLPESSKDDNSPVDQVTEILSTELPTVIMDKDLDGDFDVKVNIEDIIDKIKVVQPPMREIDPTDYYNYIEFAFD